VCVGVCVRVCVCVSPHMYKISNAFVRINLPKVINKVLSVSSY